MKKLDISLITEVVGIGLVFSGLVMFSLPLALIFVGGFLIWATEKAN